MSEALITGKNLRKIFMSGKDRVDAVRGADITIEKGEALFIIGPSGAGKSTLLHILGGLERPDSGEVILNGENIYRLTDKRQAAIRNKKIGFVFQFYHLLPEFTAIENVMLPGLIRREHGFTAVRQDAESLLAKVGLSGRLNHRPSEMSGGEQQRVAIARALINSPAILFCDEPTGNLDSKNGEAIYDLISGISKKDGLTLAIVTHQKEFAAKADRRLGIKDGLLLENMV
ncbi:MAG: ABC transporter ATP-binding protein [Candidatus Omnitrophota bacterium]|nr:ABC transporter ATP-binding protein [Candidatus Omnitrophota bacterium]